VADTITPDDVARWLGITGDVSADANLAASTSAAAAFVAGIPWVGRLPAWPDDVRLAATMLAARLYRRRNTPSGVEAFGDYAATYVARTDPDVSRFLRIGPQAMPRVG